MVINKLLLHNFGVYAGTNTFEFSNDKPVVLIGGMNGRGKTTFLNAVLISLYGSNSFAYKESGYNSYGQYLKSFVNENDGSGFCNVEITFKIDAKDEDIYTVKRKWNSHQKRVKEELVVEKNQEVDKFLTNNWLIFIENIMPSALSPYFFFDGDNIAELAVESTEEKMKESFKTLLGISILDQLENDLNRFENSIIRNRKKESNEKELKKLQQLAESTKEDLDLIDNKILSCDEKIKKLAKQLEEKKSEYISKGGLLVEQRQELYQKRSEKKVELQTINQQKIDIAATELPLTLITGLLSKINKKANNSQDVRELKLTAEKIEKIYKDYDGIKSDEIDNFIEFIKRKANSNTADSGLVLSENSIFQLNNLVDIILKNRLSEASELKDKSSKVSLEISNIDEHLSVDIDEKVVNTIFKRIKNLEQNEIEISEKRDRLLRQRSEVNGAYIKAASEYKRCVDTSIAQLESSDEEDRTILYNKYAKNILKEYKIRLQKRKIDVLTDTVSSCFKAIANKQNLIDRIEVDPVSLDFTYIDSNHNVVPKSSLSEGEKQMMIISILWALSICSKKKLPVIIDTPLARLDSEHRKSLIRTYFPNAGEQTIILSTDSEISGDYYSLLKEYVSDEFTLIYNDETKSSHIESGYFEEEK